MKKILLILFLALALPLSVSRETRADIAADNSRDVYTGNGATTSFTYNFKILTSADIAVYQAGTLKTLTTHYTLTGVGNDAGGTVVFVTAPAADEQVLLLRSQAIEQTSSYATGAISAATIERDFDRQTAINQMQAEQIARTLRYPITTTPTTALTELPTPVADKCLGYDNAGTALQMNDCTGGSGEVSTHAALTTAHGSVPTNTASRIVQRDASGNFAAGTITAALTGNASTATALAANPANCVGGFPRGIAANGDVEDCDPGVDEGADYEFTGTMFPSVVLASLPAAGTAYRFRWVSDCESATSCSSGAGTYKILHFDDGTNWIPLVPGSSANTLTTVMAAGNTYYSATSPSTGLIIGESSNLYWSMYSDVTEGLKFVCVVNGVVGDCDRITKLNSGYKFELQDSSGQAVWRLTESTGRVTFPTASKQPLKTVYIDAAGFSTDGTQCAAPAEAALNTNKPKTWYIICTDNDAGRMTAKLMMPSAWNGGTIRVRPSWFSQDSVATNIVQSWSGQCVRDGDAVADVATTGEQNATLTFQSEAAEVQKAFTAAITLQGTCAGGATIFLTGDIDATGTTYTTMANARFLGAQIEYGISGESD